MLKAELKSINSRERERESERERVSEHHLGNECNGFVHSEVINRGLIGPRTELMTSARRVLSILRL